MDITRALRYGALGLIFAVPFVPLMVSNELFFPFITGKNFTFRVLVELAFLFWALLALYDTSVRPKPRAMLMAVGFLILTMAVSTLVSENPAKSFWSNFERMEGYIGLLHLGAYFLVLTSLMNLEKHWRTFFGISIGVSVALYLYGVFQLYGHITINQGGVRVDATLGNATYFAVYSLFHAFLSLLLLTKSTDDKRLFWISYGSFTLVQLYFLMSSFSVDMWNNTPHIPLLYFFVIPHVLVWGFYYIGSVIAQERLLPALWYGAAALLSVSMIFAASTRGTILGLVGGALAAGAIFAFSGNTNQKVRKVGMGLVVGVLVLILGFFAVKNTDFVQNNGVLQRIANISLETLEPRLTIWKDMALPGFLERPVFGWGQESFNFVFNKYYDAKLYTEEPWFDRAHNAFIDWLVAGGLLGFLGYVSLYAIALYYLFKRGNPFDNSERGIFTGLLVAYAFHNLVVFDNLISSLLFFTVIAYLMVRSDKAFGAESPAVMPTPLFHMGAPIIAVVMVLVMYFANVPGLVTASSMIEGLKPHEEGLTKNVEYFETALESNGLGRQEVREHLAQFAVQLRSLNVSDPAFLAEVDALALDGLKEEIAKVPNDTRTQIFLGSLYRQIGRSSEAREPLTRAAELSPEKLTTLFELGILETEAGNLDEALVWLKKAYDLAPEYDVARTLYAAAAIRKGDTALVESLLVPVYGTVTPGDSNILAAYLSVGAYDKVLPIAEKRLLDDPTNPRYHLDLASVYLQMGRRNEAITMLEKAIQLDPSFKAQGEYFISEIQAGRNP